MASSKKWQTAKYKHGVSRAQEKARGWAYSKRKIASEEAAFFAEIFKVQKAESAKTVNMCKWNGN